MWAWTAGFINPMDHDSWRLVGRETVRFYQTHGIGRLTALSRHITDTTMDSGHIAALEMLYERPPPRVRQRGTPAYVPWAPSRPNRSSVPRVSQVCQLRRLHQLFGCDPMMWKELVAARKAEEGAAEKSGGEMEVSSGQIVTPVQDTNSWTWSDYPRIMLRM